MNSGRRLMLVAGEVSGDIHAGNLLTQLNALDPSLSSFGVGGDRLSAAGLESLAHIDELAHMGLFEVLRELPRIRRLLHRLVNEAERRRPDLAVLVDAPDFNLRLAARLRRLGVPVLLYVSPQLWAWRRGRVKVVRRVADEVLCILPFEVDFYEENGVPARYLGHPLVDDIAREEVGAPSGVRTGTRLALLPGSRRVEVQQLLPKMLEGLRLVPDELVSEAVLIEAPGVEKVIDGILTGEKVDSRLSRVAGDRRRVALAASSLAWTASGTATLECALLDVPMIVGYRLRGPSYALARLLVRVPHVALVNLIAGRRLMPELIQGDFRSETLAQFTSRMFDGPLATCREGLADVRHRLGPPGATRRAAEAVLEHLTRQSGASSAAS